MSRKWDYLVLCVFLTIFFEHVSSADKFWWQKEVSPFSRSSDAPTISPSTTTVVNWITEAVNAIPCRCVPKEMCRDKVQSSNSVITLKTSINCPNAGDACCKYITYSSPSSVINPFVEEDVTESMEDNGIIPPQETSKLPTSTTGDGLENWNDGPEPLEGIDMSEIDGGSTDKPIEFKCGVNFMSLNYDNKQEEGDEVTSKAYAKFAEFPWTLVLFAFNEGVKVHRCGAVLVNQVFAVTTAECIRGYEAKDLIIRAGEWERANNYESHPHQEVKVAKINIHEKYSSLGQRNNIALLHLDPPIQYDVHVNAICLPNESSKHAYPCYVTGFGSENEEILQYSPNKRMKKVEVRLDRKKDCEDLFRTTDLGPKFYLEASSFCATRRYPEDSHPISYGDGGDPLFCRNSNEKDEQYELVGLAAWGKYQYPGTPDVYTSVVKFTKWINDTMADVLML